MHATHSKPGTYWAGLLTVPMGGIQSQPTMNPILLGGRAMVAKNRREVAVQSRGRPISVDDSPAGA